jgi:hypothetical protein
MFNNAQSIYMKLSVLLAGMLMMLAFQGCAVVGGIFKAGVWVGVLAVVVIVIVIAVIVGKARK